MDIQTKNLVRLQDIPKNGYFDIRRYKINCFVKPAGKRFRKLSGKGRTCNCQQEGKREIIHFDNSELVYPL